MLMLLAMLTSGVAQAADCDAKQLTKDINDASPVAVPRVFLKLAECDAEAAKKAGEAAFAKILHGDEGNQAAVAGLKVGAQKPVMDWVDRLEPDHRSQSMLWFGNQCGDVPEVGEFFVASAAQKPGPFLQERWYRGMAKCRVEGVQNLLRDVVEKNSLDLSPESKFGFIEVYARNLGKDAIPHLRSTAGSLTEAKDISLLLNAFGDAANVGSLEGIDEAAAKEATAAIESLAPQIHPDAMEQARDTLLALGAEDLSNSVVQYRWPDRIQAGTYAYAVVATEDITCKNGKQQVIFHHGRLTNFTQWPDALEMDVEGRVKEGWSLNGAEKCKGTGSIAVKMSPTPVDDAGYDEFVKPHLDAYEKLAKKAWKSENKDEGTAAF